jgi:hypothetical protein
MKKKFRKGVVMRYVLGKVFQEKRPYHIIRAMLALAAMLLLLMTTSCGDESGSGPGVTVPMDEPGTANSTDYGKPDKVEVASADPTEKDITFGIITDTHIDASYAGYIPFIGYAKCNTDKVKRNRKVIDDINIDCRTAGCLGVIHMGDMIDTNNLQNLVAFRQLYEATYPGQNGGAIAGEPDDDYIAYSQLHRIEKPVFPGIGNHDVSKSYIGWPYAIDYIRDLVVDAPGILSHYRNVAYAWRWGRYVFIQLGLWAGDCEFESSACIDYDKLRWLEAWLKENVGDSGDGVLIFQHYGWDDDSTAKNSNGDALWWSNFQRQLEVNVLCRRDINNEDSNALCDPYNVIAIFTGHKHDQAFPWAYGGVDSQGEKVHFRNIVFRDSGAEGDHFGYSIVYLNGSTFKIHTKNIGGNEWYWWEAAIHLGPDP